MIVMTDKIIEEIANRINDKYSYYKEVLENSNKKSTKPIIREGSKDWNLYSLTTNQRKMFTMQNPGMGKKELETVKERNLVS